MGVIGEPLRVHHDNSGTTRGPHRPHDTAEDLRTADRVRAVDIIDAGAHELVRVVARQREEGLAARLGRDRQGVVLDQEEHRQLGADGFGDRLQHFALLGRSVAEATQHDRLARPVFDLRRDADGLQGIVAHRAAQAQHVAGPPAEMGTHLASARWRGGAAEEIVEERARRHPARDHQGLVAIVAMQPIRRTKMRPDGSHGFMSRSGHMERRLAAADEPLFERVDFPREQHVAIEVEGLAVVDRRRAWRQDLMHRLESLLRSPRNAMATRHAPLSIVEVRSAAQPRVVHKLIRHGNIRYAGTPRSTRRCPAARCALYDKPGLATVVGRLGAGDGDFKAQHPHKSVTSPLASPSAGSVRFSPRLDDLMFRGSLEDQRIHRGARPCRCPALKCSHLVGAEAAPPRPASRQCRRRSATT